MSGVTVSVAPAAAGYAHASTYTISFIATNGINSSGETCRSASRQLRVPTFDGDGNVTITDHTNPADSIEGAC